MTKEYLVYAETRNKTYAICDERNVEDYCVPVLNIGSKNFEDKEGEITNIQYLRNIFKCSEEYRNE